MRTSPIDEGPKRTAARRTLASLALCALACAGCGAPPDARDGAGLRPGADAGLRVELRFGAEADLDLYVTDPLEETVYFANTPTRSGGRLEADVRCDAPAPRSEAVVFEEPPPGRYRVGIDFPARCRLTASRSPWTLVVRGPGLAREVRGEIQFGSFEVIALEFALP
jgi:hypothetical protein